MSGIKFNGTKDKFKSAEILASLTDFVSEAHNFKFYMQNNSKALHLMSFWCTNFDWIEKYAKRQSVNKVFFLCKLVSRKSSILLTNIHRWQYLLDLYIILWIVEIFTLWQLPIFPSFRCSASVFQRCRFWLRQLLLRMPLILVDAWKSFLCAVKLQSGLLLGAVVLNLF